MSNKGCRFKIIGYTEIVREKILKERKTKNIHKETIRRTKYKAAVLECGHNKKLTDIGSKSKSTFCAKCYLKAESQLKDGETG